MPRERFALKYPLHCSMKVGRREGDEPSIDYVIGLDGRRPPPPRGIEGDEGLLGLWLS